MRQEDGRQETGDRRRAGTAWVLILALFAPGAASADWTATGTFLYRNRNYDASGFTGTNPTAPVRYADVKVIDTGTSAVLAQGATSATGTFSIAVTDAATRDIAIRVYTSSDNTAGLEIEVRDDDTSEAVIAKTGTSVASHGSTTDIAMGSFTVETGSGGDEFNIYDCLVVGADAVDAFPSETRPTTLVVAYWESGSTDGTFYETSDKSIHLLGKATDSDAYDDAVILHEYGHYVADVYAQDDSPGGSHSITANNQDPRLSWSEGWATFFGSIAQRTRGDTTPSLYIDTNGSSASGGALVAFNIEDLSSATHSSLSSLAIYATNEVAVSAVLWDITDTPGSDDDTLSLAEGEIWEIHDDYIGGLASATVITLEDFWDGWFSTAYNNGNASAISTIFAGRSINYSADAQEPNDTFGQAVEKSPDGNLTAGTLYKAISADPPDPATNAIADPDWFKFTAVSGDIYTIDTTTLLNGADTVLTLYGTDGSTVLTSNDNRAGGTFESRITWTATGSGTFFVKVTPTSGNSSAYGGYSLKISNPNFKGAASAIVAVTPTSASADFLDAAPGPLAPLAAALALLAFALVSRGSGRHMAKGRPE
ncbi:MAG: PPC domain-containing protein [Planctomycetes bacterium]|nr:PPC domain-containing protein [Planctomycetota bacterium]